LARNEKHSKYTWYFNNDRKEMASDYAMVGAGVQEGIRRGVFTSFCVLAMLACCSCHIGKIGKK
jgi:hypothetical protein